MNNLIAPSQTRRAEGVLAVQLLFAFATACTGTIEASPEDAFTTPGARGPRGTGNDPAGDGDPGTGGPGGTAGSGAPTGPAGDRDVNRVGIHRLNNAEYDNTVRDLLGVSSSAAASFIADEKALGFDTIAAAFGMTDAQYEQYFNSADNLAEQVFADPALRARILTCTPASSADLACTESIVRAFGKRAWRRPLADTEVQDLSELAAAAIELGDDFAGSIKQVVKALLSSVHFLYRVELDSDPTSLAAHPLDGYELASRLSYLLWSTMPDDALFELADSAELQSDEALRAQLDRMLGDERARAFVTSFAGQWLGLRDLQNHQVDAEVFPDWDEALRTAAIEEGLLYFSEFLNGTLGMEAFFTADVNFVDRRLAELYGMSGGGSTVTRVSDDSDARRGFLGLASFLTVTSFAHRTAPTLRGKWVLQNLLCEEIPPPPADVPELEEDGDDAASAQMLNVRERLAEHRQNPQCAACHTLLDPIGLGLENFDAIGQHRTQYANGDAIDASGMLPDGASFDGIDELSALLGQDPRLADCASEKLMTYALSRELVKSDEPYLLEIREQWQREGLGLRALLERIVLSDLFRMRRGEAQP
jgi:hypothetical protein